MCGQLHSLAAVGLGALCASAPAAQPCDAAAVRRALARTATAINRQRPELLATAYERFPDGAGRRRPVALLAAHRTAGRDGAGEPAADRAGLRARRPRRKARSARSVRCRQLGHWSVGDKVDRRQRPPARRHHGRVLRGPRRLAPALLRQGRIRLQDRADLHPGPVAAAPAVVDSGHVDHRARRLPAGLPGHLLVARRGRGRPRRRAARRPLAPVHPRRALPQGQPLPRRAARPGPRHAPAAARRRQGRGPLRADRLGRGDRGQRRRACARRSTGTAPSRCCPTTSPAPRAWCRAGSWGRGCSPRSAPRGCRRRSAPPPPTPRCGAPTAARSAWIPRTSSTPSS